MELFLVRIQSECGKIRNRNNYVFGHRISPYSVRIPEKTDQKNTLSLDTFHAVNFPPCLFSHFLNCTNPTKLRKAFHAFFQKTEMSLKIEGTFLETIHAFFLKDCLVVKSLLKSSGKFFEDIHSFILMLHGYRFTFL